jgi:cytoskeletal protein RodZ
MTAPFDTVFAPAYYGGAFPARSGRMNKSGFGDHLRREREMRGVSLDEICAATRISTRFLEALENERWHILPGGVFNHGFVRAVARFLGLDEEGFVAEYDLAISQQNKVPAGPIPQAPQPAIINSANLPWLIGVLAAVVLFGIAGIGWRSVAARRTQRLAAQSAPPAVAQPQAEAPPASLPAVPSVASRAVGGRAAENPPSAVVEGLQLRIQAGKTTTVTVLADGSRIFRGKIAAGQSRTFEARSAFEISARDGGALSLELNGRTLAPFGRPGKRGKVTVTRSDLKAPAGGAD